MGSSGRMGNLRGYVLLSLAWLTILGLSLFLARRPRPEPLEILPPPTPVTTATAAAAPTPSPLRIDVAGAVRVPGVYSLPPGSIVADAIAAAGGPAALADLDQVNKAAALADGIQVCVPAKDLGDRCRAPVVQPAITAVRAGARTAVNLNSATLQELEALPGIGPNLAQRIVAGRPYGSIEEIMRVPGIGEGIFAELRDLIAAE